MRILNQIKSEGKVWVTKLSTTINYDYLLIKSFVMINRIITFLVLWAIVLLGAYLIPWVTVDSYVDAIIVAVVIALLSSTIWDILRTLSLPINILSLWIMGFIISVLMIMLADYLLVWFSVSSFWTAALFALVIWALSGIFNISLIRDTKN